MIARFKPAGVSPDGFSTRVTFSLSSSILLATSNVESSDGATAMQTSICSSVF